MIVGTFQFQGETYVITRDGRVWCVRYDEIRREFTFELRSTVEF
jgi:predicted MarR family transcription regulator